MDIRVLRYFLAIAREESFSRAAQSLYLSQPTLSRQIREMEEELGTTLFIRTNRSVVLTREGMRLRKRAQEIVDLMDKTASEFAEPDSEITGDIYIGSGETQAMRRIAQVAVQLHEMHPGIRFHLFSGNAENVTERLDRGLLDFGVLIEPADVSKYEFLRLPGKDLWGVLMRCDHPLAKKEFVTADDLAGVPLLASRQTQLATVWPQWTGRSADSLNIVATYNLIFNASLMVEQGLGCALTLDHLVGSMDVSGLCFRPLSPRIESSLDLVWKKYQIFSPASEAFLAAMQRSFAQQKD